MLVEVPIEELGPEAGLPGSQGPSGLRLRHLASPEREMVPLPTPRPRMLSRPHWPDGPAEQGGGGGPGRGGGTVHWSQPRCLCRASVFIPALEIGPVSGKGKAYACTTPCSPLAVSFQRNPGFRKNLITHLLCSLTLHGMEVLMSPGSSRTRCWGSVAPLRRVWGGGSPTGLLLDDVRTREPALSPSQTYHRFFSSFRS